MRQPVVTECATASVESLTEALDEALLFERPRTLTFLIGLKPVSWARPSGKHIRYDSQINDKAAFSIVAFRQLVKQGVDLTAVPVFKSRVHVEYLFSFTEVSKLVRCDVDNLVKFAQDALQSQLLEGKVWTDDKIVFQIKARKTLTTLSDSTHIKITGE